MYQGVQECLHLRLFLKILTNLHSDKKNIIKNNEKKGGKKWKMSGIKGFFYFLNCDGYLNLCHFRIDNNELFS